MLEAFGTNVTTLSANLKADTRLSLSVSHKDGNPLPKCGLSIFILKRHFVPVLI